MSEVNRFVVVDETGRVYDRIGVEVETHIQDDGLTMKVFVTPLDEEKAQAAQEAADQNFAVDLDAYKQKMKMKRKS